MSSRSHPARELATVLCTDVVDSTRHLSENGDQVWARVLDALDAVARSEVRRRGGELITSTGDGSLALLPSASAAVDCASALHSGADHLGVALRIGVHTGEVERRGVDVAGIAVHVAARLMAAAATGETLASATVQALASDPDRFEDRGQLDLEGVEHPVHAYVLRREEATPAAEMPVSSDLDPVVRLLDHGRFEEAAELVAGVEAPALVHALVEAGGRTEFLDVDVTLVRMLRDVLDRLADADAVARSRVAAKLAFELRGDPSTVEERRELLALASRLAEAAGDDVAESAALLATIHALWEPDGAPSRLAAAERVLLLTRRTHHVDHELEARLARVHALVERWRVHEAGLELATYARLAARLDRPDLHVFVASRRAMLAQISGRYDEQLHQGGIAYQQALLARMPDAERLRMAHLWPVKRDCEADEAFFEQGAAMMRQLTDLMPGNYYDTDVARLALEAGRTTEARVELARALPPLFTSTGPRWLWSAANAAAVAAAVGSEQDCERLYDLLRPHAEHVVLLGPNFIGAVGEYLGALALRLGRIAEATEHLQRTVAALTAIAALPWIARTKILLADALRSAGDQAAGDREATEALELARSLGMTRVVAQIEPRVGSARNEWSLQRDGEAGWILIAGPEHARLPVARGFEHLAVLLANPGTDIAAEHLDAGTDTVPGQAGLPALDDQALASYRRRIQTLEADLERADRRGDQGAARQLEQERQRLVAELRRATGLGGRVREAGGSSERARVNVTRNLKRAMDHIQRAAPIVGAHLVTTIKTGRSCRYQPEPNRPLWQVTPN